MRNGLRLGGRGVQLWPRDVMNPGVNVSSVRDPQGRSAEPPQAADISHMLASGPDTVCTSPVEVPSFLIPAFLSV